MIVLNWQMVTKVSIILWMCPGSVEEARASYIIRDFEKNAFEIRKEAMQDIADKMIKNLVISCYLKLDDQYYNMKSHREDMTPVTIAKAVMEDLSITPIIEPIPWCVEWL